MSHVLQKAEARFEAASAIWRGTRAYQEDAVVADCPVGGEVGLVVLSDGMGGYRAGDLASKIVMTEVFSELTLSAGRLGQEGARCDDLLRRAVHGANACIRAYAEAHPESRGMGATLVAGVFQADGLHWVSVGDSPLYLIRHGEIQRLNADHSFASVMKEMIAEGALDEDAAASHPDRSCLTSVVAGGDIASIDCPDAPLALQGNDVLVFASDGVLTLEEAEIESVVTALPGASSADLADALLQAVAKRGEPEQDNLSIAVVRVQSNMADAELTVSVTETVAALMQSAGIVPGETESEEADAEVDTDTEDAAEADDEARTDDASDDDDDEADDDAGSDVDDDADKGRVPTDYAAASAKLRRKAKVVASARAAGDA